MMSTSMMAILLHFILYWVFVIVNTMVLGQNEFNSEYKGSNKSLFFTDMMSYTIGVHTGGTPVPNLKNKATATSKLVYFIHTMLVYLLNLYIAYKLLEPADMFVEVLNNN